MSAQASPSETVTQTGRPFQIDTVLGPNALLIRSFHGHEAVSELFAVDLELASEDFNIPAARLASQPELFASSVTRQTNVALTAI